MKVCIYGAGAIGGWIGMALARTGAEVNVVARGATLAALRANGLTFVQRIDGAEKREQVQVNAVEETSKLGVQSLVVVAVKAPALKEVASRIAPLLGADTIVLTAMNGVPWWFFEGNFGGSLAGRNLDAVDPDGLIGGSIPSELVLGSVVHASCSLDSPGVVRNHSGNSLIVGEPSGGVTQRVQRVVERLVAGGIHATASSRIQKDVWYKLWGNMTVNPISAITGATMDKILDDEHLFTFISKVMLEAKEVGERIGIPISETTSDRLAMTRKIGAFKTSMLQDVEASRAVELDALVSSVREIGQALGLKTPYTDALLGIARLHAKQRGLY